MMHLTGQGRVRSEQNVGGLNALEIFEAETANLIVIEAAQ
jgi:hypothetical protein